MGAAGQEHGSVGGDDDDVGAWISKQGDTAATESWEPNSIVDKRISMQASQVPVMPAERGSIKKLVKKPAAGGKCKAPVIDTVAGTLKLLLCTHKSYVVRYDTDTKKWPLFVECHKFRHRDICSQIFDFCRSAKKT